MDLHHRMHQAATFCNMFSAVRAPTTLPFMVIQLLLPESRQALQADLQALSGASLDRCVAASYL